MVKQINLFTNKNPLVWDKHHKNLNKPPGRTGLMASQIEAIIEKKENSLTNKKIQIITRFMEIAITKIFIKRNIIHK